MARILVIDDDETFSYVLKRACSRQGHEVMLSASACEAKEASAGMFDIVFLDISLPDGNGLSLLPLLLGSEGHPEVIVITGHDNRDWLEQHLWQGHGTSSARTTRSTPFSRLWSRRSFIIRTAVVPSSPLPGSGQRL